MVHLEYVGGDEMKLTIIGPDNHDFLQSIINGEYVSLKDWPGAKLFVGNAYDKYLETKKATHDGMDDVIKVRRQDESTD